ncbi:MAG: hypothetical protein ACRDP1_10305 [Nocardioidaceae bacterium]
MSIRAHTGPVRSDQSVVGLSIATVVLSLLVGPLGLIMAVTLAFTRLRTQKMLAAALIVLGLPTTLAFLSVVLPMSHSSGTSTPIRVSGTR